MTNSLVCLGITIKNTEEPTDNDTIDDTVTSISPNTIYGIKQNYLIYGCLRSNPYMVNYYRFYEATGVMNDSNRYTIFYTTGKIDKDLSE